MRKINSLLVAMSMFVTSIAFAQSTSNPWLIGVGAHATDHTAVNTLSGVFDTDDMSFTPPLSKLTIARSLNKSFALDLQASVGEIDNNRLAIKDEFFLLAGLGLRYKLTNGYLLKEDSWFDPYLRVGGNYHKYDYRGVEISQTNPSNSFDKDGTENSPIYQDFSGDTNYFVVNGGLGINFWFTKSFGLNIESQYNYSPNNHGYVDFLQHSASLVFKFGNTDKDKDGIKDKDDECPEVPGLAAFKGCPDTDGDGIQDKEDSCPTEAGPIENKGCPWGDADGDGLKDNEDSCPNEAGPRENKGCPWKDGDGDGVLDKDDECPTIACPRDDSKCKNNGCPRKIDEETTGALNNLLFDSSKATIRPEGFVKLDVASKIIKDAKGSPFFIDGHTDSSGKEANNIILSKNRAAAVVKALEERGVPAGSLIPRGFGSSEPKADNTTAEGKQANRRVVVKPALQSDVDAYKAELEAKAKKAVKKVIKKSVKKRK